MAIKLIDLSHHVKSEYQSVWKIKGLELDGHCVAENELTNWLKKNKGDYNKIIKALKVAGTSKRVLNEKLIKKDKSGKYEGVYEARADKGSARLFFFYSEEEQSMIICTNAYWKNSGNQETSYSQCYQLKEFYEGSKGKKQ